MSVYVHVGSNIPMCVSLIPPVRYVEFLLAHGQSTAENLYIAYLQLLPLITNSHFDSLNFSTVNPFMGRILL